MRGRLRIGMDAREIRRSRGPGELEPYKDARGRLYLNRSFPRLLHRDLSPIGLSADRRENELIIIIINIMANDASETIEKNTTTQPL